MLQEVLEYIHNYFIKATYCGSFALAEGTLTPQPGMFDNGFNGFDGARAHIIPRCNVKPGMALQLKEGQRFWLLGSDLNDGVYTWRQTGIMNDDDNAAAGLQDETFAGTICALAVPPAVIALSEEIRQWVEANSDQLNSPFKSETFNGYSYTLRTGSGSGTGGDSPLTWRDTPAAKALERWRRPSV